MSASAFQYWLNQIGVLELSVRVAVSSVKVKKLVLHGMASLISATVGESQWARA